MLCQNCGKNEANIRYTQIINGVKKEVALCSECAAKLGLENIDLPINFNSFLGDFFNDFAERELLPNFKTEEVKCKKCGMTYDDFINTGMFGCSECYDTFGAPIDSLLKNLHGTAKHIGRGPNNKNAKIENEVSKKINDNIPEKEKENNDDKKTMLEQDLAKAIKEERYEDAAKIRDQLKEMNK